MTRGDVQAEARVTRAEPRPGGERPRPWADAFVQWLSRRVLGLLYREITLAGVENFPATGPVIVIANHQNSLVDGGMLLAVLPRVPRFLAASTVWDYRPVAPFMDLAGAVRVHRRQDGRAHEGSLNDSFAEVVDLLAAGGVLAVFPEGQTHDSPALLPFKTGTARIAGLAAEAGVRQTILPVGIDYEAKSRFRSRVLVTFGAPMMIGAGDVSEVAAKPATRTVAARRLTARLEVALREVAPDFADRQAARLAERAGTVAALPERGQGRPSLAGIVAARRDFVAAQGGAGPDAEVTRAAEAALSRFDGLLGEAGLSDAAFTAPAPRAGRIVAVLATVPILALASLLNGLPVLAIAWVSRSQVRDRRMTWVAFGGLTLFPLTCALWALGLGLAAGAHWGPGWGWAAAVAALGLAPLAGLLALPVVDRAHEAWHGLRARRLMRRRPALAARLRAARDEARAALAALDKAAKRATGRAADQASTSRQG